MKPLNKRNYGKIPHLSSSNLGSSDHFINIGQENILTVKTRDKHDVVLAFEKYDGSNVGVCKINGSVFALTKSGHEAKTSPYLHHRLFFKWVESRQKMFNDILKDKERVVGEWLIQAHGLRYEITKEPIVFFDYFNNKNERKLFKELESTGLPTPRLLWQGGAIRVVDLIPVLNKKTPNIRSYENPEGIVYRLERKDKVSFLAKWVRGDFESGIYIINVPEEDSIWNVNVNNLTKY